MKLLFENWRKFLTEEIIVPTDITKKIVVIYDFDETIAGSEGYIDVSHRKTGKPFRRITTQDEYDKLKKADKYDFDFSNLVQVTNPTEFIPVTKRLRDDANHRSKQVMVLTARAPAAEDEIQMYLDSIGIPTEDLIVIGCAGCNKGEFVEDLVRRNPTIEVINFYDDSDQNIEDMEAAKDRLKDLKRLRTFIINQVTPEVEIKKKGSALGAYSGTEDLAADLFAEPKPQMSKYLGRRGPGGRIGESLLFENWRRFLNEEHYAQGRRFTGWDKEPENYEKVLNAFEDMGADEEMLRALESRYERGLGFDGQVMSAVVGARPVYYDAINNFDYLKLRGENGGVLDIGKFILDNVPHEILKKGLWKRIKGEQANIVLGDPQAVEAVKNSWDKIKGSLTSQSADQFHKTVGTALGYPEEDVDRFIAMMQRRRAK